MRYVNLTICLLPIDTMLESKPNHVRRDTQILLHPSSLRAFFMGLHMIQQLQSHEMVLFTLHTHSNRIALDLLPS